MKELLENIGREGSIYLNDLRIEVVVKDIKMSYGKVRYLVVPIAGSGEVWIEKVGFRD